jgi:hypothetical protein
MKMDRLFHSKISCMAGGKLSKELEMPGVEVPHNMHSPRVSVNYRFEPVFRKHYLTYLSKNRQTQGGQLFDWLTS